MGNNTIRQKVPTNISNMLDASVGHDLRLDTFAKNVLADKQILAYLLKYTTKEFEHETLEDIQKCIEPDIKIGKTRVEPGLTNVQSVEGNATESNIPNEGIVIFDIIFRVNTVEDSYTIIVNIEAQKSSDPTVLCYHIENRMTFYMARMISSQKQIDFTKSNYDDMKKVKSIWICMDSKEDSIIRYSLKAEEVYGEIPEDKLPLADRIEGIVIRIRTNDNYEESKNNLIHILEDLFSRNTLEQKKILLEQDGIQMTEELERSVEDMCNYSALVKEEGIKEGLTEGLKKGKEEGITEGKIEMIMNMHKKGVAIEDIASYCF